MLAGGSGVISVIGQAFPKQFSAMINHGLQGNNNEGYAIHYKMMDLVTSIFEENNPAGIKSVLQELDICRNDVRLPLVKASSALTSKISQLVANFS